MEPTDALSGHDLNEDDDHVPDECRLCLEANHTVENACRCGECCKHLIIEVTAGDASREPLIKVLGRKLRNGLTGESPPDDEADWLPNGKSGPCVFLKEELCSIHETRPLVCRLFCCDKFKRDTADHE